METLMLNELEIVQRLESWLQFWEENQEKATTDAKFVLLGEQHDEQQKSAAEERNLQLFVFNILGVLLNRVLDDMRARRNTIQVIMPPGESLSIEAEVVEHLIHKIILAENIADEYLNALKNALVSGSGALYVALDYENEQKVNPFKKKITVKAIPDDSRYFFDPKALEPHKGDGEFCGFISVIDRQEAAQKYGSKINDYHSSINYSDLCNRILNFASKNDEGLTDKIAIVEFFAKEITYRHVYKTQSGKIVWDHKPKEDIKEERIFPETKIRHYTYAKNIILESKILEGQTLFPLIFHDGNSFWVDGKQVTCPITHFCKDAQRLYNFIISTSSDKLKLYDYRFLYPEGTITAKDAEKFDGRILTNLLPYKPNIGDQKPEALPPLPMPNETQFLLSVCTELISNIWRNSSDTVSESKYDSLSVLNIKKRQGIDGLSSYYNNHIKTINRVAIVVSTLLPLILEEGEIIEIEKLGQKKTIMITSEIIQNIANKFASCEILLRMGDDYDSQRAEAISIYKEGLQYMGNFASVAPTAILDLFIAITDNLMTPDAKALKAKYEELRELLNMQQLQQSGQIPPDQLKIMMDERKMQNDKEIETMRTQTKIAVQDKKLEGEHMRFEHESEMQLRQANLRSHGLL